MTQNTLYFGDNLDVLRERIPDEAVDLIYLDPPFNSQARYNVLFQSPTDQVTSAQAEAFRDTWTWGHEAERAYSETMKLGGSGARLLAALRSALGASDMMAYLSMMTVRLYDLHRVLKRTGTLYLHCDPTASHYLKIMLDSIFGGDRFQNEIIWQRTTPKGLAFTRFPSGHDSIIAYRKSSSYTWNPQYLPHRPEYIESHYNLVDEIGRRFQATSLLNPNPNRPNLRYTFHGHTRVWRWTEERMKEAERQGRIYFPAKGGVPREKRYLDEQKGTPITSVWTDISALNSQSRERLSYPTQKPSALLERIIRASSREGDIVLDPFCGCGTSISAAESLDRKWIGIDVAIHAIRVIEARLGLLSLDVDYRLEGIPKDFESALKLAQRDKYQFQWWANYLFNPHALRDQKKGADRGIDGELFFPNGPGQTWGRMLTSVKGGETVGPAMVRDFRGALEREQADMGLFICLYAPTKAMIAEAASAGFARTVHAGIPKLQIVAIEEWFEGRRPLMPPLMHLPTTAVAPANRRKSSKGVRPDPRQPQFKYSFSRAADADTAVHVNPVMVSDSPARQAG